MHLSVVIPTLNEAEALPETLRRVRTIAEVKQLIVSDGGSGDATRQIALEAGAEWITGPAGRGIQCRAGAERATGEGVIFLHADTWLPSAGGAAIVHALGPRSGLKPVVAGAFRKQLRAPPLLMRGSRLRSILWFRLTGRPFADQAIFVRRTSLEAIGGFPDLPLMEEFELIRRLRTVGDCVLLVETVSTSARRFRKQGVLRTYAQMSWVLWGYARGVNPHQLREWYEGR